MIVSDDRIAPFVAKGVGVIINPPYTCVGIERSGEIVAGVVFNHFTGHDMHITVAGSGWTRGFFADVGAFVFGRQKCLRMTAVTAQPSVVKLAERLGGKVEGVMRDHFGEGKDGYLIGFMKNDWPY